MPGAMRRGILREAAGLQGQALRDGGCRRWPVADRLPAEVVARPGGQGEAVVLFGKRGESIGAASGTGPAAREDIAAAGWL